MSTPITSLTASGLTALLSDMISQLSGQPPPPPPPTGAQSQESPLVGLDSSAASTSSASSTASSSSTSITILQGGHSNSVLSLALNADGSLLASGGEDGYLCLWLTSENRLLKRRPLYHIPAQSASSNSRASNTRDSRHAQASSTLSTSATAEMPINHVVFANRPQNERRIFVSCGTFVYEVDVERFEAGDGPYEARLITQHGDDVNQVALNDTETLLAACDDNGFVKVIELETSAAQSSSASSSKTSNSAPRNDATCSSNCTPTQTSESASAVRSMPRMMMSVKKHSNICSSVCFRRCSRKDDNDADLHTHSNGALTELGNANSNANVSGNASASTANGFKWQLISGGMDCKLQLVEFQRKGRSVNIFDMNEFIEQDSATFVVNPPFIHTVAITSDGGVVACGLENGNIELFDARRKNLTHLLTLYGHTQAVAKVLFVPSSTAESEQMVNSSVHVNYLVSAGNDGNMFCWEVKDTGITTQSGSSNGTAQAHSHQNGHMQRDGISIKVVNCVEHWHKINWIEAKSIDKVYIGDQSTQIALCSLLP